MVFRKSDTQYTSMGFRYDDNGTVWVQAVAHGALTAKTSYRIVMYELGLKTAALASGTTACMIGFPKETYATGDIADMQVGGAIDDATTASLTVSVGQFYKLTSGILGSSAGSFTNAVFGVGATAASSSTTNDFMLIPKWIIAD